MRIHSFFFAAALPVGLALSGILSDPRSNDVSAGAFPADAKTIVHVLNRIGFGPRAGDVHTLRDIGLQRYIEQQLYPERIADTAMATRLSGLTTVAMSSREIAERFALPQLQARRARKGAAAQNPDPVIPVIDVAPKRPAQMQQKANRVVVELAQHKLLRAVYSERQLQEVLTDFWFNHFNVDARKGPDRFLLTEYEREAIRPHVLGRFRDLLEATAKSPAMLFYLDNWMSADPNRSQPVLSPVRLKPDATDRDAPSRRAADMNRRAAARGSVGRAEQRRSPRGLNENYGRELMDLHTLGVDGGYTQKDVTEVARAFTGWTIQNPRMGGGFRFEPRIHDRGEKTVLGHRIKAGGGEDDGRQVLDILARHPATSRFIATKLARRFVGDHPPPSLVDRAAARFRESDGDLREVMRTILAAPEFLSADAHRAKVKTPLEFVVSALRATGAEIQDAGSLVRVMQQLGMPLYLCQPPTGYKDTAEAWVNAGALVARMNVALQLASNKVPGITVGDRRWAVEGEGDGLLGGDMSEATRATIARATGDAQRLALALGSPEFQKR